MEQNKKFYVLPVLMGIWQILTGVIITLAGASFLFYMSLSLGVVGASSLMPVFFYLACGLGLLFLGVSTIMHRSWIRPWGLALGIWGLLISVFTALLLFSLLGPLWATFVEEPIPGIFYGMAIFLFSIVCLFFTLMILTYGGEKGHLRFIRNSENNRMKHISDPLFVVLVYALYMLLFRITGLSEMGHAVVFGVVPPVYLAVPYHLLMLLISALGVYFLFKGNARGLIIQAGLLVIGGLNGVLNYQSSENMRQIYSGRIPPAVDTRILDVLVNRLWLPLLVLTVFISVGGLVYLYLCNRKVFGRRDMETSLSDEN